MFAQPVFTGGKANTLKIFVRLYDLSAEFDLAIMSPVPFRHCGHRENFTSIHHG